MENNKTASTTIITGRRTRLSYANLFEPKGFDGAKPMYSASLIIPKDDHRTLEKINAAIADNVHYIIIAANDATSCNRSL